MGFRLLNDMTFMSCNSPLPKSRINLYIVKQSSPTTTKRYILPYWREHDLPTFPFTHRTLPRSYRFYYWILCRTYSIYTGSRGWHLIPACACVRACVRSPTRQCGDESVEGGGVKVQCSSIARPHLLLHVVPGEEEEHHRNIVSWTCTPWNVFKRCVIAKATQGLNDSVGSWSAFLNLTSNIPSEELSPSASNCITDSQISRTTLQLQSFSVELPIRSVRRLAQGHLDT